MKRARIIGRGRAGSSVERGLIRAGWAVDLWAGRGADLSVAADGVDFVILAVPDHAVVAVSAQIRPNPDVVLCHLAGALTLDALATHPRVASIHPLVALPGGDLGANRLAGAWMAFAGDAAAMDVVEALDGRTFRVDDGERVRYHAAAVIASNHVVALLGQVNRLVKDLGIPFEPFVELARSAVDNVADLGPEAALTGPVARGDWLTVRAHIDSLPAEERPAYEILAQAAARLKPVEVSP